MANGDLERPEKGPRWRREARGDQRGGRFLLLIVAAALLDLGGPAVTWSAKNKSDGQHWIGTWATAPQPAVPSRIQTFRNQSVRLIVRTSVGGKKVRVKISNTFGEQPLVIGGAHIARRGAGAGIDASSDRVLKFRGRATARVAAGAMVVSDAVDLDVPALSDLAVSVFFPENAAATTEHILALQTNYVSTESGDATAKVNFPVAKTISFWPFLTGVDVMAAARGAAIVAFGSSTTDGDGSTKDANHRWPDLLAERLQKEGGGNAELGVLNEGIIGNRLLSDSDSPRQAGGPFEAVLKEFGGALGPAGLARFERDVLAQAGVRYVIVGLGVNDILFPGAFIPESEKVSAPSLISGYRQLIERAHQKGIRVIATTIAPFEDATFQHPTISFFTADKESVRQEVNTWMRRSREFDGVVDLDEALRDPGHPTKLLSAYDSDDHLHVNDAGNVATAKAISLSLFQGR